MNQLSPAVRKIIYCFIIAILIIPLSLISLPETRDGNGVIRNKGGQLSVLREEYGLSQAKLSEIDPASETMKLASLGLRGIAVSTLWMQAMEHKKKEEYDQLASTLKALTKIQPNFVKVWEFQAHNLAYNVSMEFDDYEYRYHWVKKGISFLKEGIDYNKTDHRMTDTMGFYTGNKMGKSDEKESFRRMFRQDSEFHGEMKDKIDPSSYETLGYGHDSWKMAYQWYDYSRNLVETNSAPKRTSDMLFYMYRPAQIRNQGLSLQTEFRTEDVIQEVWRSARDEWRDYGEEPLTNTLRVTYTLEGMAQKEKELQAYRDQLDKLAPGVREESVEQMKSELNLPDDALYAWKLPPDQRTDEQVAIARDVNAQLNAVDENLDHRIADRAKPEDQIAARRLAGEIAEIKTQMSSIDRDTSTINYAFWKSRNSAEASDTGVRARQAIFEAEEMRRRSIYDDEIDRDYKTKEVTITKRGAISLYLDAFEKWHEVLEEEPGLKSGPLSDDIAKWMTDYRSMLVTTNREWPDDFPLQDLIDFRSADGESDRLPTSEELAEQRSGMEESGAVFESPKSDSDDETTGKQPSPEPSEKPETTLKKESNDK